MNKQTLNHWITNKKPTQTIVAQKQYANPYSFLSADFIDHDITEEEIGKEMTICKCKICSAPYVEKTYASIVKTKKNPIIQEKFVFKK